MARRSGRGAIVLAAVGMVATLPGRSQGIGLITAPLLEDFAIGPLHFARWNLIATLIGASVAVPAGWFVDRVGVRRALSSFQAGLAATVLLMARVRSAALLVVALVAVRCLGQTALSIASLATVGKWYRRHLEKAMGVYALLLGMGFVAAFPGVQAAVATRGWRPTWTGVSIALAVAALLTASLLRDGRPPSDPEMHTEPSAPRTVSIPFARAIRSPAFWVYSVAAGSYAAIAAATGLFTELMLRERGLDASVFRLALATTALVGIAANFLGGLWASRHPLPLLLGGATALLVPTVLAFSWITTPLHAFLWAAALGGVGGLVTVVFFAIWGKLFGPDDLGKIQGAAQAVSVVGSAVGPIVFGYSAERWGGYGVAFALFAPWLGLLAVACVRVGPPQQQQVRAR